MSLLEPMDLARNLADSNIISNFEHVSLPKSSNDDEKMKYLLCQRFLPNAIKHCTKEQLEIRFVTLCQEYLTDCQPYLNFLIPNQEAESALRAIADTYSSSVGLTYYHWGVNGIPYYPINEEGTVSNGAHGMVLIIFVDYGSWGGGYSNNFDVRDYWRMNSKAGGNWYEGLYGYGTGWNVPIMQNFGAEGGGGTQIHIPIKEEDFGKPLRATNGYFVGPYAGVADSTAVDWLNGRVTKQNGFASPYTGVNVYSGSSVGFPSINSVVKNLARKTKIHNLAQILAQVNTSAHHALN
ncbi:unnamed protein product [Thelazia callipaeda]|uniref:Pept_C1 domain-containing protein n=1 Tax=Thelazia callipaeda TaxID=103827 RepID=A0A0N5D4A9_THECL|nr:unnamed protein product [Thelazia callipaeda]